jgi:hypothetical protein
MKNIKQIREAYDSATRKEDSDNRRFTSLVRAGLYDPKKLPALKRAFEKGPDHMTAIEKRMLLNLLDSLMAQVVSNQPIYQKVRTSVANMSEAAVTGAVKGFNQAIADYEEKPDYLAKYDPRFNKQPKPETIPTIIILKRKAIRIYPDNQKVALYYAQGIDKYVSIPFGTFGDAAGINEDYVPLAAKRKLVRKAVTKKAPIKKKPTTTAPVDKPETASPVAKTTPTKKPAFKSKAKTGGSVVGSAVSGALRGFAQAHEEVLPIIKQMVNENIMEKTIMFGKEEITINNTVAKKIMSVHESMNRQNRKTMENMLNESADSFNKVVTFATRY